MSILLLQHYTHRHALFLSPITVNNAKEFSHILYIYYDNSNANSHFLFYPKVKYVQIFVKNIEYISSGIKSFGVEF